jgi:hypothetical protein
MTHKVSFPTYRPVEMIPADSSSTNQSIIEPALLIHSKGKLKMNKFKNLKSPTINQGHGIER